MLVQNMASLVVAMEKNIRFLWSKHAENELDKNVRIKMFLEEKV